MKHISLQEFTGLSMPHKVNYFNQVVGRTPQAKWENALLQALINKNPKLISQFGGLMPFYNAVKDSFGQITEAPEAKSEQQIDNSVDLLKSLGLSAQISARFKGISIDDLVKMNKSDLEALKGIGAKTADQVLSLLKNK